ncbi:MAG: hypothetical protein SGPRY_003613, partial [Prymnesium sp.]
RGAAPAQFALSRRARRERSGERQGGEEEEEEEEQGGGGECDRPSEPRAPGGEGRLGERRGALSGGRHGLQLGETAPPSG